MMEYQSPWSHTPKLNVKIIEPDNKYLSGTYFISRHIPLKLDVYFCWNYLDWPAFDLLGDFNITNDQ